MTDDTEGLPLPPRKARFLASMFSSLSVPAFRRYALGAQLGFVGSWALATAQILLVVRLTGGDGTLVGAAAALQFVPLLLLGPIAGVIADRTSTKLLFLIGETVILAVAVTQAILIWTEAASVVTQLVLAVVLGVGLAMENTMRSAIVHDLVPDRRLPNAISLNSLFLQIGRLAGPSVAALLAATVALWFSFAFASVLIAVFIVVLLFLPRTPRMHDPHRGQGGVAEAIRWIGGNRGMVLTFVLVAVAGLVGPNVITLATLTITNDFHLADSTVGFASSTLAAGTIAGALFTSRFRENNPRTVAIGALLVGVFAILAGLAWNPVVYFLALVPAGFAAMLLTTQSAGFVQRSAPSRFRGRITALYSVALMCGVPLGAPLLGALSGPWGARFTSVVAGGVIVVTVAATWLLLRPDTGPDPLVGLAES